jgi:hypothetical protein
VKKARANILMPDEIEDRLSSYPHLTPTGELEILNSSPRPFQWKGMGLKHGILCMSAPFIQYYYDVESIPDTEIAIREMHNQLIEPHFQGIEGAGRTLKELQEIPLHQTHPPNDSVATLASETQTMNFDDPLDFGPYQPQNIIEEAVDVEYH